MLVDANMRIVPEVLDFTNHLTQQGKSINSIRSYIRDLKTFYEWMELEGLQVYEVKPSHIPSFIKYVDSKNVRGKVSAATLNRYLATLSTFYRYFGVVGGFIQEVDSKSIPKFKHNSYNRGYLRHVTKNWNESVYSFFKRKNPKKADKKRIFPDVAKQFYLTIEELWIDNERLRIRNKLIFKVLYETGMRIGELLHLRVVDYDYPEVVQ
ncbi:tyrosine-type recombinase/integrase [Bacillus sp. FSL R12-0069]|uniref:tyrosine-type recombinase/integrase n=1 Tax=Bacillus sp. FSL R12-0069 TaxID=2975342 RepID=UPI0030F69770